MLLDIGQICRESRLHSHLPERLVIATIGTEEYSVKYGTVVLADSHLNLTASLHSLLEELFDSVIMVSDENSLLMAVKKCSPGLVVVDLSLPSFAGAGNANVARHLMSQHPDQRLIILSVYDDPTVVAEVCGAGAAGFVLKRTAAVDLLLAVQAVLAGGT